MSLSYAFDFFPLLEGLFFFGSYMVIRETPPPRRKSAREYPFPLDSVMSLL